jgi:hypothetical protein
VWIQLRLRDSYREPAWCMPNIMSMDINMDKRLNVTYVKPRSNAATTVAREMLNKNATCYN